ncbi:hypothetical protein ASPZODRAFT_105758 [Penicilliopsis zonata CBS 506.65]|uniref:Zn(2)-C6 fungal-type domain-containing protein n=1 Tax=Penicilliopsis zonata CBS 506.65 TaxID=1073090 RepID=A0A1L9S4P3_9EURO|nr:hypothetical protein ASPZODRAFT_105758 [Penicilliopsis zonata CBS 506.65]OJJ42134.1 hypothetical protein ASPZODRAFT_105758 [Penicilliopsis zonata CBS 506.65]
MENRRSKRAAKACVACRQSKIRCTGERPCQNCHRRKTDCYFSDSNTKVLISERYLRDLQNQARGRATGGTGRLRGSSDPEEQNQHTPPPSDKSTLSEPVGIAPRGPSQESESMLSIWTSPFALPTTVIKDAASKKRNWLWLAPTSPWSFVARLAVMMSEKLNLASPETLNLHLDGDIYPLDWSNLRNTRDCLDTIPLPSVDQAIHAFNTVKFYLNQIYRLLNADFAAQIQHFYERRAAGESAHSRMWLIQLLLVLAFGKVFSSRTKTEGGPPGSKLFLCAMSLMPNHTFTCRDSLAVIENLALISLYLYSIDHREGAHSYIGQAIRIAQLEGLHTQLPEDELGHETVTRCRNIWWSLYIIDRQISSALGLPMTVQDFDISALVDVPGDGSQNATFSLQVRLSQMMSSILSKIFRTEKTPLGHFMDLTREILQAMAGLAEEIEDIFPSGFQSSMDTMPHDMRFIILLYHKCVILATRPLLLSVLKERMEKIDRPEEEWHQFLVLPRSIVSIGIKSAIKSLEIISDDNIILETFLPFDLEFTFAAALHLTIADTLFQFDAMDNHHTRAAHQVLDRLVSGGNRVAEVRRTELLHMQFLFGELSNRIRQQGIQGLTLSNAKERETAGSSRMDTVQEEEREGSLSSTAMEWHAASVEDVESFILTQDSLAQNSDSLEAVGISSNEFLSIVDQIGSQGLTQGIWDLQPDWLIEGNTVNQGDFNNM